MNPQNKHLFISGPWGADPAGLFCSQLFFFSPPFSHIGLVYVYIHPRLVCMRLLRSPPLTAFHQTPLLFFSLVRSQPHRPNVFFWMFLCRHPTLPPAQALTTTCGTGFCTTSPLISLLTPPTPHPSPLLLLTVPIQPPPLPPADLSFFLLFLHIKVYILLTPLSPAHPASAGSYGPTPPPFPPPTLASVFLFHPDNGVFFTVSTHYKFS